MNGITTVVEKRLNKVESDIEVFEGIIKVYGNFVAVISERGETFESWLRKRATRYKDREVKVILITDCVS